MKILVTGASGQVGRELQRQALAKGWDVLATDQEDFDITNEASVDEWFGVQPDVVFNAAAWTAVEAAETNEADAFLVNAAGAANLARACARCSIPLVHYSTDYVFDGSKDAPYTEEDAPNPISVYGRSKLAAEESIRETLEQYLILRTSWVFSAQGQNFVKTMLRVGAERGELKVVADQYGKPTSAAKLAEYSLAAISGPTRRWGIYHVAQPAATSWCDFASAIFDCAASHGAKLAVKKVVPVTTADYPTVAKRPENSVLDCTRFEKDFDVVIDDWHDALNSVIRELISDGFFA